ncbi:MAG: hypothetical protein M1827_002405 [Pycnora praestabilis]|nr:MAG: hypothetical protein M1827_002405 [Pycnora praestabilis]
MPTKGMLYKWEDSAALELHNKRHREIGELVQSIQQLDCPDSIKTPMSIKKRKTAGGENDTVIAGSANREQDYSQREATVETSSDNLDENNYADFNEQRDCTPRTKEKGHGKRAKKAAKKAARCYSGIKILTSEEVQHISNVLHPQKSNPLRTRSESRVNADRLDNPIIKANLSYTARTFEYYQWEGRKESGPPKPSKGKGVAKALEGKSDIESFADIFKQLGVRISGQTGSRERKNLLSKLCEAIQTDLSMVENEDRETMMRMAGYWRFVNKRAYNNMVANHQIWDWKTGAKLTEFKDVEEEEERPIVDDNPGFEEEVEEQEEGGGEVIISNEEGPVEGVTDEDAFAISRADIEDTSSTLPALAYLSPEPVLVSSSGKKEDNHIGDTSYTVLNLASESLFS